MTRRALAFDAVGLIDFNVFQGWTSRLFQLMRQPAPPGFKEPSLTQLLRTDRQAFVRLQELSRDGIKPRADGTRPLDGYLGDMRNDSSVMFYMLPTQQRDRSRSPAKKASGGGWNKWSKNDHGRKRSLGRPRRPGSPRVVARATTLVSCLWLSRGAPVPHPMVIGFASLTTFLAVIKPNRARSAKRACTCVPQRVALAIMLTTHATTRRSDRMRSKLDLHRRCRHRGCLWNLRSFPIEPRLISTP